MFKIFSSKQSAKICFISKPVLKMTVSWHMLRLKNFFDHLNNSWLTWQCCLHEVEVEDVCSVNPKIWRRISQFALSLGGWDMRRPEFHIQKTSKPFKNTKKKTGSNENKENTPYIIFIFYYHLLNSLSNWTERKRNWGPNVWGKLCVLSPLQPDDKP